MCTNAPLADVVLPGPIDPSKATAEDLAKAFERARHIARWNLWVGSVLTTRRTFCDYGRTIVPVKRADRKKPRFTTWLAANKNVIDQYVRTVWMEALTVSNVTSAWFTGCKKPLVLPVEQTRFTDKFDFPRLRYFPKWTEEERRRLPQE